MIAVSRSAAFQAFGPLATEMAFAEGRMTEDDITDGSDLIREMRVRLRISGENLMRLTAEWMLRAASDAEIDPILVTMDPEDFRPLLARAYSVLWGELPEGPVPRVALLRPEAGAWDALRQSLYGQIEGDLPRLRSLAEAPELLDGAGRPVAPELLG